MTRRRARHGGTTCALCGTTVVLDEQGRCLLGHQVRPRPEPDEIDVSDPRPAVARPPVVELTESVSIRLPDDVVVHAAARSPAAASNGSPRILAPLAPAPTTRTGMPVFDPAPSVPDPGGRAPVTVDDVAFAEPSRSALDVGDLTDPVPRSAPLEPLEPLDLEADEELESLALEQRGRLARALAGVAFVALLLGAAVWLALTI